MKSFELSEKAYKNGRRKFKAILYEIYPEECFNDAEGTATRWNLNGISWREEFCRNALPSIEGMSLRCSFADEDRTELLGHGETDVSDGLPVFEDAVVIGTFKKGYINTIEVDGEKKIVCIGEGTIDGLCYHNLVAKLDEDAKLGYYPKGSVEILKTADNDGIVYQYGYKEKGRIPKVFEHSGYALLGVQPADNTAQLIELNNKNKEDNADMTVDEIKAIINDTLATESEINSAKANCTAEIEKVTAEKEEAVKNAEAIASELEACKGDCDAKSKEIETLNAKIKELEAELDKAKAAEKCSQLNEAIASFTEEEKAYAEAEINAFNSDPLNSEINAVTSKIYEGIGMNAKKVEAEIKAETNSAKNDVVDIFSAMEESADSDDNNIF